MMYLTRIRATTTPRSSFCKTLEDYVPKIHIHIFNYLYLRLLIVCFLLSLGSRHQRSNWCYALVFIRFGFITFYMTVAAFSPSRTSSLSENKYVPRDERWMVPLLPCQVVGVKNPYKP